MRKNIFICAFSAISILSGVLVSDANACTRLVYLGVNNHIITARSMDWTVDVGTNLWIFPRGMSRVGAKGDNPITWTSKYGSVIASAYDAATTDGMNEAGLVANALWLVESTYPNKNEKKPEISIAAWAQYVLDNYSSVQEAIDSLKKEPFSVITDKVPGDERLATLHLSLSDSSGDSAIIEYINGKQIIHHNKSYQVMTNSPSFDKQLVISEYWKSIGGATMLPGSNSAIDRFARATFYVNAIPKSEDTVEAIASTFSVIRNVSVPYGISTPNQPNISSTRWRTVADQKNKTYFFESAFTPNVFWTDLKEINFSKETGKVMKLDLGKNQSNVFSGNANSKFKESAPFKFLGM